jgi:hypothetical protein
VIESAVVWEGVKVCEHRVKRQVVRQAVSVCLGTDFTDRMAITLQEFPVPGSEPAVVVDDED